MKKEEVQVMGNISLIQKKQGLLLEKVRSVQQQLFQIFGQRHLLKQKMMHRQLEDVLQFLPGTFGHQVLYLSYISTCLEMKIELDPQHHPLLKKLLEWSDTYPQLKDESVVSLVDSVTPVQTLLSLKCYEQYITYLNFIGSDLIKLVLRRYKEEQIKDRRHLKHVKADDILQFLINSLPKVLFNIILPVDVVPPQYKAGSMQILYRSTNIQYFIRSSPFYSALIKMMIKILFKLELNQSQQKMFIEIVFRYFFCFHNDKKFGATDIFIEAYNYLHQSVRFAMADQFTLFFKIARKIGKNKFCDFLMEKSQWLKQIFHKVSDGNFVGYAKESLNPFCSLKLGQNIVVANGKVQSRIFEILQDYSLFYFIIDIPAYDITVRLNYLGTFNSESSSSVKLLNFEKHKGSLKTNIMAAKKGIYQFQFDNSYSWINKKVIRLEKIVLSPLEFSSPDTPTWISSYYDNVALNEIKDKERIFPILKKLKPKKEEKPQQHDGVGNVTKDGNFFNLKVRRGQHLYQFQSENEQKLMNKFNQIVNLGGKIKWMVNGDPLQGPQSLKKILISAEEKKEQPQKNSEIPENKVEKEEKNQNPTEVTEEKVTQNDRKQLKN